MSLINYFSLKIDVLGNYANNDMIIIGCCYRACACRLLNDIHTQISGSFSGYSSQNNRFAHDDKIINLPTLDMMYCQPLQKYY